MQSVRSLRDAITQQHLDAESKRILADSLMKSAEQHEANGDDVRAKLDRDSAERYLRDLSVIENNIANYESEVMKREQKAKEIEKRIEALHERFKHDLQRLEKDKQSIGIGVLTGTEREVIRRGLNNRNINSKEKDLQKHYDHDLQKLIDEQKLILG